MYNCSYEYKYENLLEDFEKRNSGVALLVIDVQSVYCAPEYNGDKKTVEISKKINSLAEEFRKAAIPVFSIYYSLVQRSPDFYNYNHGMTDFLIRKFEPSAFEGSFPDINDTLEMLGVKTVISCGFKQGACVAATAVDAKKEAKLNSFFIEDLSSNGRIPDVFLTQYDKHGNKQTRLATEKDFEEAGKHRMISSGVQFIKSEKLIQDIKTIRIK